MFSRKRKIYICEDCSHEFVIEKSFAPLRIFLSYGHDGNEGLVRQIKSDLEKRGHDVWFDKSEIKSGNDWRRSITDGITSSHKFVSFLSKHSTRDPGVCLDEIAIAIGVKGGNIQTILVESENDVKPPSSISHIQWLDMHDWKEWREAGKTEWEKWYQEKLDEIICVVESDESRRFAGEIETLAKYLKPISSDSRIFRLLKKGLVGRTWLTEAIDKWREEDRASRLFWITGAPGVGKSAFAAHLAHFGRDRVIAVQFCDYQQPDHRDMERIVRTIAFQIATRLPDYRKFLLTLPEINELNRKNPSELFDYLLTEPLRHAIDGGRERYLIVIDALDEAAENGRNLLVEMLAKKASQLPEWLGIIVTSRPESNVTAPLQWLNPFVLDTATESNRNDIRAYLKRELATQLENLTNTEQIIEQILDKSEGVFLYIERFCEDVQRCYLSLNQPDQFPQGLGGIFYQYFQRQFPDEKEYLNTIEPMLGAILAAREPLPIEIIQKLFGWRETELKKWLRKLGSLFIVTTEVCSRMTHYDSAFPHLRSIHYATPKNNPKVIKPYHKSLADWLSNDEQAGNYFVSLIEGHKNLGDLGWEEFRHTPRGMSPYSICNLLQHFVAIGDAPRLQDILNDHWFLEHSPVFYREEFYRCLAQTMSSEDVLVALAPALSYFAQQAAAKSPTKLGYTLFPHEPGVIFDGGTPVYTVTDTGSSLEYTIPRGAVEPPSEVLYDFVKCCHSTFLSTSAFLRGVPNPAIAEWHRNFWKQLDLQATLDDIERYYGFCAFSLSHRAMELSWEIDKVLDEVSLIQQTTEESLPNSGSKDNL
jgi:hypothetical protein